MDFGVVGVVSDDQDVDESTKFFSDVGLVVDDFSWLVLSLAVALADESSSDISMSRESSLSVLVLDAVLNFSFINSSSLRLTPITLEPNTL